MAAQRFNFTKAGVAALKPASARVYYRDKREPRLGLYVTPKGTKTFFSAIYLGGGIKRIPIGRFPDLSIPRARQKAAQVAAQAAEGIDPVQAKRDKKAVSITLEEVLETYLNEHDLKPGTIADYRRAIKETFGNYLNRPLANITEKVVRRMYMQRGGVSKARADNAARVLRAIFNFARARYKRADGSSLFPDNPVDVLRETRMRYRIPRRKRVIEASDLPVWWNAVLQLPPVPRDWFHFLLFTGVRREEALRLVWGDIKFRDGMFVLKDTKNREEVVLPLTDYMKAALFSRRQPNREALVFTLDGKVPFDPRKWIDRVKEASGVEFSPHDLRRTYITIAESLDISAYTLKALINHKMSGDVTAGYLKLTPQRLAEASRKIENKILDLVGGSVPDVIDHPAAFGRR